MGRGKQQRPLSQFFKTLDSKEKVKIGVVFRIKVAGGRATLASPLRGDISYRVLPFFGKLAGRQRDHGGNCFRLKLLWLNFLHTFI